MKHLILSTLVVLLTSCGSKSETLFSSKKQCTIPGGTVCVKCDECLPVWRNGICNHCGNIPSHALGYVEEYHAKVEYFKARRENISLLASVDRFGHPINTFGESH